MRWVLVLLLLLILIYLYYQFSKPKQHEHDLDRLSPTANTDRKVIWILVDSLMSPAIDQGVNNKELPALSYLIQQGIYNKEMVSSFPTMSVTVDSTLLTGTYPDQHRIPGLIWFDLKEKRLVNYGTGLHEIVSDGIQQTIEDAAIHLNNSHLSKETPTVYEELADRGIQSGSINGMIYRGRANHVLSFPSWMASPTPLPERLKGKGPDFLSLGAFSNPLQEKVPLSEGPAQEFGFNDDYAIETTRYLIQENRLPDFLFVYLPDLDKPIHKKGGGAAERQGLQKLDQNLQKLLDSFSSWEEALEKIIWVIAGDGGQTPIHPSDQNPVVRLDQLFQEYHVLQPGHPPDDQTELVLAVNERSAYVYSLKEEISLQTLADILKTDERIDLIAFPDKGDWIRVLNATTDQELLYRMGEDWTDSYEQAWDLKGDPAALDLSLDQTKKCLSYGDFPDALARLSASLNSHAGRFLVVTTRPGYELADTSSPQHKGGAGHGSLHRIDSVAPIIIAGTDQKPRHWRIVDLKAFILDLMKSGPKNS
ncbi:putative AlkP superfamily pyrophosphatase or phosphodiesterase [Kroppenstedtia sanguinis]|uniref:Alkaline phosphatase family protein n=1 Tax=Kroppenstedtia sanguinis TaxID=1380684 RepID=A0ABW4C8A0_9BACL